ncbi:hypothetical protein ACM16X_17625 [Haloarcula japonica]|uniref:hypothetical protein n=1 Tax=Haloarcula japonica TaxID=29282 RepID=UPI0039F68735
MTPQPSVGEIVAITTTDSEPRLLVSSVTDDHVSGVLLTDLAAETVQRVEISAGDRQRQSARRSRIKPKEGRRQPRGNGVPSTPESRHPRRRVLDPGQSMNPEWSRRRWSGDQNPTNQYTIGIKKTCDSSIKYSYLTVAGCPSSRYREVGR